MIIILLILSQLYIPVGLGEVEREYVDSEVLIKFVDGADINKIKSIHSIDAFYQSPHGRWWRCSLPVGMSVDYALSILKDEPGIEFAQPNYICRIIWTPNDPFYSYQWHFPIIDMPNAWEIEQGGDSTVIIGILDTGVAYKDHPIPVYEQDGVDPAARFYKQAPDLHGVRWIPGYDFVHNDAYPNDDHGHGTHIAGTIASTTNNMMAVAGIAFNCAIMPIKMANFAGIGNVAWFTDAIYYAVDHGADVINMSVAFSRRPGPIAYAAVQYAAQRGVIMVAGSGNFACGHGVLYPAGFDEVIAVNATTSADSLAFYSNFGEGSEFSAPGGDMFDRDGNGFLDLVVQETMLLGAMNPGSPFANPAVFRVIGMGGTSMATPHVSALCALMLSHNIPRENIREILQQTAVDLGDVGYDTVFGYGRIDAYSALGGNDTIPPSITEVTIQGDTEFGGPYAIWARIEDQFGLSVKRLWYKIDSGDWQWVEPVVSLANNKHLFYIPEVTGNAWIRYYIEVKDNFPRQNRTTAPNGAPDFTYSFIVTLTGIEEDEDYELGIMNYELTAYPNPFRGSVRIAYSVMRNASEEHSTSYALRLTPYALRIYDLTGHLIRTLPITDYRSPITEVTWDGKDNEGISVPSGIYFIRFDTEVYKESLKMVKIGR